MIEFNVRETRDILDRVLCTKGNCSLLNTSWSTHLIVQSDKSDYEWIVLHRG